MLKSNLRKEKKKKKKTPSISHFYTHFLDGKLKNENKTQAYRSHKGVFRMVLITHTYTHGSGKTLQIYNRYIIMLGKKETYRDRTLFWKRKEGGGSTLWIVNINGFFFRTLSFSLFFLGVCVAISMKTDRLVFGECTMTGSYQRGIVFSVCCVYYCRVRLEWMLFN